MTSFSLNLANTMPTQRSEVSSALSGYSDESARLGELSKVRNELEEALRQVKAEMRQGGATRSQLGTSTARSQSVFSMASNSSLPDSVADWDLAEVKSAAKRLNTNRGKAK